MALDLIKSINERSLLIADLKGDESMEIQRKAIKLHGELGKGAFGIVKRGTLMKDGMTVAVKMLKSEIRNVHVKCHPLRSTLFISRSR